MEGQPIDDFRMDPVGHDDVGGLHGLFEPFAKENADAVHHGDRGQDHQQQGGDLLVPHQAQGPDELEADAAGAHHAHDRGGTKIILPRDSYGAGYFKIGVQGSWRE